MLENEMQFRMDLEKLKAQVAELDRRIEDRDDGAEPPMRVEAGNGVEVQAVAGAWRVSATGEGSGPVLCKVTSSGLDGYRVNRYDNGPNEARTGAATLYAAEIGDMDLLPAGTWLLGWPGAAMQYEGAA
jgi:hypothetical protein